MASSRRKFLRISATAAAGWWCASYRLSAAEELPEFSFIIASDTHLGRQDNNAAERQWRQAAAEIADLPGDFVLHLGDIVDGGREEQYPKYLEIRRTLKKPVYEVPGNHDPHELFQQHVRPTIDSSFDHQGVRFLLLGNSHVDSHFGFFTAEQIEWVDRQCRQAVEQKLQVVVACHVPLHQNAHPDRGWFVKPDSGQTGMYQVLDRHAPHCLALFHGHFHNGIRGWRDRGQLVEVLCPSVCYNQDRKLGAHLAAGRTTGFLVDELRAGYVLATLGKGRLTLRYKPLGAELHGQYQADWS